MPNPTCGLGLLLTQEKQQDPEEATGEATPADLP